MKLSTMIVAITIIALTVAMYFYSPKKVTVQFTDGTKATATVSLFQRNIEIGDKCKVYRALLTDDYVVGSGTELATLKSAQVIAME